MRNKVMTAICLVAAMASSFGGTVSSAAPATSAAGKAAVAVDRAEEAGLAGHHKTWQATEVDYNRDGARDVWIGNHGQGANLWRNTGSGTYTRVVTPAWPASNAQGRTIDRHDCVWADVDRNGLPDAYCSTGRFLTNIVKHGRDNELWLQIRRGTFREVGTEWKVGDVCGRGRDIAFLDANGDRFPDLFLGNETPRDEPDPCNRRADSLPNEKSKLFINTGGDGFRYARNFWDFGAGPGSRCAEVLDLDGDGWDDLLACQESNQPMRLYRNKSGHGFADVSSARLPANLVTDAVVADLDGDGDPDLITAAYEGFAYHLNTNGRFGAAVTIGAPPTGVGRSVAVGDADRDGDLDVFGVVAKRGDQNPDDIVWLNDALSFSPVQAPSAGGTADEVIALHPGSHGRAEFLVMNGLGRTAPGPIQLIRLLSN